MHFPWKKVKSTRLSRLVNDHLNKSQKRRDGSSLVVETGFATSLVDLFIKNREKLKNSGKKRRRNLTMPFADGNDSEIAESLACFDSPPPPPPPSSPTSSASASVHCPSPESSLLLPGNEGVLAVESDQGGCPDGGFDVRKEFSVVLKTVLVVCFAVGSKRLTVGITVSAFLLVFLEYVGRCVCRLFKVSLDFEGVLTSIVQRICVLFRLKDVKLGNSSSCSYSLNPNREIQIEEKKEDEIQEIEFEEEEEEEPPIGEKATIFEVAELKRTKSRKEKIRSKMQKLFQKKSRSRKEHEINILKQESFSSHNVRLQEHQPHSDPRLNSIITTRSSKEDADIQSRPNWSYNLAVSLIILTGLIGGRASALVLTLTSCLLFKLSQTLPRYIKMPAIRRRFST